MQRVNNVLAQNAERSDFAADNKQTWSDDLFTSAGVQSVDVVRPRWRDHQ
jgi:hypothetical protein